MLSKLESPSSVEFVVELLGVRVLSEMPGDKALISIDVEPSKAGSKGKGDHIIKRLLPEHTQSAEQKRDSPKS